MGILTWVLVGAVTGWFAGKVLRGRGFGCLGNIGIGIAGALVGGWLAGKLLNISDPITGFNFSTLLVSFLGATLVLFLVRLFKK